MGSGTKITTTASTTPVTTNAVNFTDLPPAADYPHDTSSSVPLALIIPLVDVQEITWRTALPGMPVSLDVGSARIKALLMQDLLGFIPPQYTETIRERNLTHGVVHFQGREPQEIKVSLSA